MRRPCAEVSGSAQLPGLPRPKSGKFFSETPGTYTIVERCGNFIYPIGDSKQAQILLNMGTVLTDVVFSYRKCPTSQIFFWRHPVQLSKEEPIQDHTWHIQRAILMEKHLYIFNIYIFVTHPLLVFE